MTCISKVWFAFWQTYQQLKRALRLRHTLIWRKVSQTYRPPALLLIIQPALRLLLADWKSFWCVGRVFFFNENGRYSEAKSWKIDPKVANRPSCRGLQTGHWRNPGSYSKKRIFGPKSENFGPKKNPLLNPNHVPATTGQCCPKEKVPFYQIINGE